MIKKVENTKDVEYLFDGWTETFIWSCLQKVMGELYTDNLKHPTSALAALGDFIFFAGIPNKELVLYRPQSVSQDFIIMVPQNDRWGQIIEECYQGKFKKKLRYATKKEPHVFNKEKLQQIIATLPQEYSLQLIEEDIYKKCKAQSWCKELVSYYTDYKAYHDYGLGVAILKEEEVISGASSYSSYNGGIEIQINTNKQYRRKGFASICGAKLILECLKRNLYPSWDAQNECSLALAEKLGYHYSHSYVAYDIKN